MALPRSFALGSALACLLAGAVRPDQGMPRDGDGLVAQVGRVSIAEDQVSAQVQVLEAQGLPGATPAQATLGALREALEWEVARAVGVEPTPDDLAALDRHAANTSRKPEALVGLRRLLGQEGFSRHVLKPRVAVLRLREFHAILEPGADATAYDRWFRQQASRIALAIGVRAADDLCRLYGEVWWLQRPCAEAQANK